MGKAFLRSGSMECSQTISPAAIMKFVSECEASRQINLTHFALIHNDEVLARFCKKPYKEDGLQLLFSMTKSFTSLATGIAIDKGLFALIALMPHTCFLRLLKKYPAQVLSIFWRSICFCPWTSPKRNGSILRRD
ncbi:hypothetical protein DQG13_14065 [Paenibacillus sp. YN15]|nr:hypothetical protein DQG13_14065 [Paenibacillus sp. YN15]